MTVVLAPVDAVDVTLVMDLSLDILMSGQEGVQRFKLAYDWSDHDVADAIEALQATNPPRIEHDRADRIAFAWILRAALPAFPRRPDPPDEIQRRVEFFWQCDGNFAFAQLK